MRPTGGPQFARCRSLERRSVRVALIGLLLLAVAAPALTSHAKIDVVTTDDGNTFIGEIKSVQYATLTLKTDAAATLTIEWRRVTSLTSKFDYRVEVSGGIRYFGSLGAAKQDGRLSVVTPSGAIEVDLVDVVAIAPIEDGFWKSFDGSVSFGLTYTQSNDSLQYNLTADASRRKPKRLAAFSGQSILNTQEGNESSSQHYTKVTLAQIAKGTWGLFQVGELQSNPDQGYDVRLIAGGGATNFLIEDSFKLLALNLGVVYNRESVTDAAEIDESAEVVVAVAFQRFKRTSHSPSVDISFATFTDFGGSRRFRGQFNLNVGWKVVGDLKFSVQVNNNYDTDPPGTDSNKNSVYVVTSFGYTF